MEHANRSPGGWEYPETPLEIALAGAGLVSNDRLEEALAEGLRTGRSVGDVLLAKGWIREDDLAQLSPGESRSAAAVSRYPAGEAPAHSNDPLVRPAPGWPADPADPLGGRNPDARAIEEGEPAVAGPAGVAPAPGAGHPIAARHEASVDADTPFRVVVRVEGGEDVIVSEFGTEADAQEAAREFIARLARRDEWPLLERTFVRPDRIFAVEISERQRWRGSGARMLWGGHEDE